MQFSYAQSQDYSFGKQLVEGWNLIGYYGYKSAPVDKALEGVWNQVEAVKDMDSHYLKQNPAILNTLDSLRIGNGYFVKVTSDCYLTFSGCEPADYVGDPVVDEYALSLTASPANSGSVSGAGNYAGNTQVTITATAELGYTFNGWTGDVAYLANASLASTTVTMPARAISLTANFTEESGGENFTVTVDGVDIDMIFVQGGTYMRGCDDCEGYQNGDVDAQYEQPEHQVTLSDYHVGKFEITNAQWVAVMGGELQMWESPNAPKVGVDWYMANEFCCNLNNLTGRSFRLLTDAEWEFAARGGNAGVLHDFAFSGSNNADDVAWHSGNSGGNTHDVGTLAPNELGVYDMSGNGFEWVFDWLVAYPEGSLTNPVALTGTGNKTRRGGAAGEPDDFSRVSRRAIRSRLGAAGMSFRIAHSPNLFGMESPCEAAVIETTGCEGHPNRDCRIINAENEVWTGDLGTIRITEEGLAVIGMQIDLGGGQIFEYAVASGQWYTLNNRSFNIVKADGSTETLPYYLFSDTEITLLSNTGMPYRLYRTPVDGDVYLPSLPNVPNPSTIEALIANVEPERLVSDADLQDPANFRGQRDLRIVPAEGTTWFMDGRCCGGNHKYRFHLQANGEAEFVVMDYDDTHQENILAKGTWFTTGNIALHIEFEDGFYNYLYIVGERTQGQGEYQPAGPIFGHISFQHYEKGDFRIFSSYTDDQNVHRPQTGSNPVYEPEPYTPNSSGAAE